MHSKMDRLTIRLFPSDALNMDDIFKPIHGSDFSFSTLVPTPDDRALIAFAYWNGADLGKQLLISIRGPGAETLTLYFSLNSLLKDADMIVLRTLDGALKCAARDFRREEWMAGESQSSAAELMPWP
jgi:hypothetical protein